MMRYFIFLISLVGSVAYSKALPDDPFRYPVYFGAMGGVGSTTWEGLVPTASNQNIAMNLTTPVRVEEGGGVWGVFLGYELSPFFAFEASYIRYPDANVYFDETSLFAFENDGQTHLFTKTDTLSFMGKLMLIIPHTTIRAYSSVGVARVQRIDSIAHGIRVAPTFGLGANYNFTQHIMGEIGFQYTAGYGESELNPARDYIPFLYATLFKIAYRF